MDKINFGSSPAMLFISWFNYAFGVLTSEPFINKTSMAFSVAASCVYIYTNLDKHFKQRKK